MSEKVTKQRKKQNNLATKGRENEEELGERASLSMCFGQSPDGYKPLKLYLLKETLN